MSSSPAVKKCYNSNCKHLFDALSKGWRRRNGHFADLCLPCASAFEEGIFCETFHINASGWRCCESCGKQIHCGCIVSFHMFVLLDAGGIECMTCARKSFVLTPNPAWPPPSLILPLHSERVKDISSKNWCHIAGSGPVPWRQAPSYFGSSGSQPDLRPRMPVEVDLTGGVHRLASSEKLSVSSFDEKKVEVSERLINGSPSLVASEKHDIGTGINFADQATHHVNGPQQPSFLEKETHSPHETFPFYPVTRDVTKDPTVVSNTHVPQPIPPHLNGKHCPGQCETESSGEVHTSNGRPSRDSGLLNQSLRRYWPRISDQELQQLHGTSKSTITPLFEKKLSVSDTRNIGRLVLPKKCAEAYFPPITSPEGLSLNVQDLKGKEWTFQFRFWTNNKSRMYVLEGVNHCIQSMNLQAGDVVTFNLVEPEGKLVMGFRKVLTASPSNQDVGFVHASNASSTDGDDSANNSKFQASSWCKNKKGECKVQEVPSAKATVSNKRKHSIPGSGSKDKCFRMEKNDPIEMELTWKQAQGLLRAPLNRIPRVVVIEGCDFEEFEDAPVIGRPTIIATDSMGEIIQWAQCEDCLKWRKVPGDASLSSRWTCSGNSWDPERSSCSMAQELTEKQVAELLPRCNQTASKNTIAVKQEPDSFVDLDGLGGHGVLAIQDEGDANPSPSQATIKHPRHGPGCTCIVCIQPPSGESPRHEETCTCKLCLALKKRLETLMPRRKKKRSEREAQSLGKKLTDHQSRSTLNPKMGNGKGDDFNKTISSFSPLKGQFDLNFQPERDEEQSSGSDSGDLTKLVRNTTESSNVNDVNGNFRSGNRNNFIVSHLDPEERKCRGTQR